MDVVEALRADWTTDPFKLVEKDGYFYGRGSGDDKDGLVPSFVALLKLKAAGFKPNRDIVILFTGDEETQGKGAELGATEWRKWTEAEFALNADGGGGGFTRDGKPLGFGLQTVREDLPDLFLPRPQSGRAQLAAASRQCDLRARRRAEEAAEPSLHAGAERDDHASISPSARSRKATASSARRCAPGSPIPTTARPPTRSRPIRWRSG